MYIEPYQLKSGFELLSYEFISEGPKGLITKRIQFTLVNRQGVYNLAFGDKNSVTGEIDDKVVSNNEDSERVLATVVDAVFAFFDEHPDTWIFAVGSTPSRTRLYQIGITKYYDEISYELEIYGRIKGDWYSFEKNTDYRAFIVKLKTS